jgi:hypothetical protein
MNELNPDLHASTSEDVSDHQFELEFGKEFAA